MDASLGQKERIGNIIAFNTRMSTLNSRINSRLSSAAIAILAQAGFAPR